MADSLDTRARDKRLVAAFRAGDADAFEEIVRLHRRRLFVIAVRRVGSVEAAEDAVQVTLTKAYRHLVELRDDVDLAAWLASVVQNAALDQVRSQRRHERLAERAYAAGPTRAGAVRTGGGEFEGLERRELGGLLLEAIHALPDPYRRPLELYHVQGLRVEEIAALLALNQNTVKSHLARGRGILRRRLGPVLRQGGWL